MKVYLFNVYSKDFGWKPVYAATVKEAEEAHGEYEKYAEEKDHVSKIVLVTFNSASDLCNHMNSVSDRFWD